MKKMKFWTMMLLVALFTSQIMACGDDSSDNDREQANLVDGVHVNKRRLHSVKIRDSKETKDFRVTYDIKGKLTKIEWQNQGNATCLIIDYDKHLIEYLDRLETKVTGYDNNTRYVRTYVPKSMMYCGFTLNERGFISQIGDYKCSYDNNGYLVGVNSTKDIWSLLYNDGDIIRSTIETLKTGNTDIYYIAYKEEPNSGLIYFSSKEFTHKGDHKESQEKLIRAVITLIAYHSGLFGNISKHCTLLPSSSDLSAYIDIESHIECICSFDY